MNHPEKSFWDILTEPTPQPNQPSPSPFEWGPGNPESDYYSEREYIDDEDYDDEEDSDDLDF